MAKKTISLSLICALWLSLLGTSAVGASSVGAGTRCKALGAKVVKKSFVLVCKQQSGKRVWVRVQKAIPLPTPAKEPSTSNYTGAWAEFASGIFSDLRNLPSTPFEVSLVSSPSVGMSVASHLQTELASSLYFWSQQQVRFPQPYRLLIFSERDRDWLTAQLPLNTNIYKCAASYWFSDDWSRRIDGGQCQVSDGSYISVIFLGTQVRIDRDVMDYFEYAISHELVHAIQTSLMGLSFGQLQEREPCWFVEGLPSAMGSVVQRAIAQRMDLLSRDRQMAIADFIKNANTRSKDLGAKSIELWTRDEWMRLATSRPAFGSDCRALLDAGGQTIGAPVLFGYRIGYFFAERYLGEFGLESMLQVLRRRTVTADFESAFEEVTGTPMNSWLRTSAIPYMLKECGKDCSSYAAESD